jgi:acetylornithine deacetylase
VRMAIFPGQDIQAAREEIESTLGDAARKDEFLKKFEPEVIYHGFLAEGYALAEDQGPIAQSAIGTLESAHETVADSALERLSITATTDARFFGLYSDMPALVYGPRAEAIHGFNERVELESMRQVTQTTALFIANWCGLESN